MALPELLAELQAGIVTAARAELLPRFAHVERQRKRDGSVLTEADTAMQSRMADYLKQLAPETAFLGEEMTPEQQARLLQAGGAVWCLDPLDGTGNFACGIPYY